MSEALQQPEPLYHPAAQEVGAALIALETDPNVQRAIEVSTAIDPEHTLPSVELVVDPTKPVGRGSLVPRQFLITHEGGQIGKCTIVTDSSRKTRWFNGVDVGEFQGQGFGTATYKAAIERAMLDGFSFQTHEWSQTGGAKKVWERLAEKGVARVVQPFESDGGGKFNGQYVVDAL